MVVDLKVKEKYEITKKLLKFSEGDKLVCKKELSINWEYPNGSKRQLHYLDKGKAYTIKRVIHHTSLHYQRKGLSVEKYPDIQIIFKIEGIRDIGFEYKSLKYRTGISTDRERILEIFLYRSKRVKAT